MSDIDIFPAKLAKGDQFCNRVQERDLLKNNIEKTRHTVLVSPRRYGKSSLAQFVIDELDIAYASIDLFLAHNDKAVVKRLLDGISEVVSRIMPIEEKAFEVVKKLFSRFKASMQYSAFKIEMAFDKGEIDTVDQVYSALSALAELAKSVNQKAVIFIDEFQDIAETESSKSIQGAIRHVAQDTSELTFIFSGSNRHLLLELFDDKSMPLYMLCDKLHLERITSEDYIPHIQKLAKQKWGKEIPVMVMNRVLTLTELHPFYVNMLCNQVWQGAFPDKVERVEVCWLECMESETRRIRAELEKFSKNQQDVLQALSLYPTPTPTGREFSIKADLSVSSLHQAVNVLFEKDMLFKVSNNDPNVSTLKKDQVRVLDPLISFYLKQLAS